jgi:hypothetical protein
MLEKSIVRLIGSRKHKNKIVFPGTAFPWLDIIEVDK